MNKTEAHPLAAKKDIATKDSAMSPLYGNLM
jgi:hypothetical protein